MMNLKQYIIPALCAACFGGGVYVSHLFHQAQEAKQLQEIQNSVIKQQQYNNKLIKEVQASADAYESKANTLTEKLHASTLTNVPCVLNARAISLWNQSSSPSASLPSDTPRVIESPTTAGGSQADSSVTIDEALTNKVEEDKEYNESRDRIIKLNAWNESVFGK